MKEYNVIPSGAAKRDMLELRRYIAKVLHEPGSAARIYASVKAAMLSLHQNPLRCPVLREEPYATLGVRWLPAENYIIFFLVHEQKKEVRVLRVAYNRRDLQNVL